MYILLNSDNKPFAVIENMKPEKLQLAIEEEFLVINVKIKDLILPDWGEQREFDFIAKGDDGGIYDDYITITKVVFY